VVVRRRFGQDNIADAVRRKMGTRENRKRIKK
jgi:hypothetical protein